MAHDRIVDKRENVTTGLIVCSYHFVFAFGFIYIYILFRCSYGKIMFRMLNRMNLKSYVLIDSINNNLISR